MELPVIDVGPFCGRGGDRAAVAARIGEVCRAHGFFSVVGHGVDAALRERLFAQSREFFALDEQVKLEIAMGHGGRAWRGYFPLGGELTSGVPDLKEGIYFGEELGPDDSRVRAGLPLHGANLFPAQVPGLRASVLEWIAALTRLGHALTEALSLSLGRDGSWIAERFTTDPILLLRIFHYPARRPGDPAAAWAVGEHTDYGFLTLLAQDGTGGLEVRSGGTWIDVPPLADAFVCNLGDMLDRLTGGIYRSTPHRVRPPVAGGRISLPFFFDPGFAARLQAIHPIGAAARAADRAARWDSASVHEIEGTYGEYLLGKVSRVFPALAADALDPPPERLR